MKSLQALIGSQACSDGRHRTTRVRECPTELFSTSERNGYAENDVGQSEIQRQALNLPAQERIELVVELWDSLAPGEIPVPDWQRDLIRDRLAALEDIPSEQRSVPWEAVRGRVFSDES